MYEKVKLVAFDLGYTLLFNIREDSYMKFLEEQGLDISREKVEKAYHLADKDFMRNYPGVLGSHHKYHFPWYIGLVNYYAGESFDILEQTRFIKAFNEKQTDYWKPFPWTEKVLALLKENGYQVALLSNWDSNCRKLLKHLQLEHYFDYIFVSSEVNVSKPDPQIFDYLIEAAGAEPENILYVGDNYYDDFIGAEKAGIKAVIINRFGQLGIEELTDISPINNTEDVLDLLGIKNLPKRGERKNA